MSAVFFLAMVPFGFMASEDVQPADHRTSNSPGGAETEAQQVSLYSFLPDVLEMGVAFGLHNVSFRLYFGFLISSYMFRPLFTVSYIALWSR